jgi:pyruvate/2-oxoglutarate dehydrogenase complex dihydrolipoamide dehydrogenase (E3) component
LIATGSKANIATYQGNATDEIITNDEFFAKMELPQSLT